MFQVVKMYSSRAIITAWLGDTKNARTGLPRNGHVCIHNTLHHLSLNFNSPFRTTSGALTDPHSSLGICLANMVILRRGTPLLEVYKGQHKQLSFLSVHPRRPKRKPFAIPNFPQSVPQRHSHLPYIQVLKMMFASQNFLVGISLIAQAFAIPILEPRATLGRFNLSPALYFTRVDWRL